MYVNVYVNLGIYLCTYTYACINMYVNAGIYVIRIYVEEAL